MAYLAAEGEKKKKKVGNPIGDPVKGRDAPTNQSESVPGTITLPGDSNMYGLPLSVTNNITPWTEQRPTLHFFSRSRAQICTLFPDCWRTNAVTLANAKTKLVWRCWLICYKKSCTPGIIRDFENKRTCIPWNLKILDIAYVFNPYARWTLDCQFLPLREANLLREVTSHPCC